MPECPENLTPRQWEVALLIAEGLTNPEIAGRLYVERSTVESHVHALLDKLELQHRTQIAVWVERKIHETMDASDGGTL